MMAISFPLDLPTAGGVARVRWGRRVVVADSVSPFTLDSQVQVHQGQIWTGEIVSPPLSRANWAEWEAFVDSLNGKEGTFLFGDPLWTTPRGTATGTPLIKGAAETGQDIETDGWTTGVTGILKKADKIQIGSGSAARLFTNLVDADSDGSGNATLTLWPKIRTAFADNAPITVSSPKGVFRMTTNEPGFETDPSGLPTMVIPMRSVV